MKPEEGMARESLQGRFLKSIRKVISVCVLFYCFQSGIKMYFIKTADIQHVFAGILV